ncbi:MAG: HAMP domain-containing protein [Bacteroidota bacterium]
MKIRHTITKKLVVYYLLLNIIAIAGMSLYSYFSARDALISRTMEQLNSVRFEKKTMVERFFVDRQHDIEFFSESKEASSILNKIYSDQIFQNNSQDSLTSGAFFSFFDSTRYFKSIIISDTAGNMLRHAFRENHKSTLSIPADQVSQPLHVMLQKISSAKKTILQDYTMDPGNGEPAITIGTPIETSDKKQGFLIMEISIEAINAIMFNTNPHNGLGKTGEAYLVGSDHLMRSNSRFHSNSIFKTKVNTEGVTLAFSGQPGVKTIRDYRNIRVFSSFCKLDIAGLDWAILAEIDEEEAMVSITEIRDNIIYLGILISILMFGVVYAISLRISLPIRKLSDATEKIADGDYSQQLTIPSKDEVGTLTSSFNRMSHELHQKSLELEEERVKRLSSMIDGQEIERQRLSRELHDGLGQSLLAIRMKLERMDSPSEEKISMLLKETLALTSETIQEVRHISNDLMPGVLSELNISQALAFLCRDFEKNSSIKVQLETESIPENLPSKIRIYLYRIAQEALNNIAKHSGAKSAQIRLYKDEEEIRMTISDAGTGFDKLQKKSGNGLVNINERIRILNGEFFIESSPEKGTRLMIRIPVNNEQNEPD